MLQRREREAWVRAKLLRSVDRPVGIVKKLPADRDHVGLAFSQDRLGLVGVHDQPNRDGRNIRFGADPLSQTDLIAVLAGMLGEQRRVGNAAGRTVDRVDADTFEDANERKSSSIDHPASSSTERRTSRGLSAGQRPRTASTISTRNGHRFSSEPPYRSSRRLAVGDRNSWIR